MQAAMTLDATATEQRSQSEVVNLQQRIQALEAELAESENTHRLRHGLSSCSHSYCLSREASTLDKCLASSTDVR